jgi:hypothetical protein
MVKGLMGVAADCPQGVEHAQLPGKNSLRRVRAVTLRFALETEGLEQLPGPTPKLRAARNHPSDQAISSSKGP